MFNRRTLAACCVLAFPSAACLAQSTMTADQYFDNRWYITPFGAYVFPDGNRNAKDGWGGGVAVGKPINPYWNIELRTQYEQLDGRSAAALAPSTAPTNTRTGAARSTRSGSSWAARG